MPRSRAAEATQRLELQEEEEEEEDFE